MSRQQFQKALNKVMECQAELKSIELQIQRLEEIYLHHTWEDGNIVTGWNPHSRKTKGQGPATKDKMFSLSSTTSSTTDHLQQGISKQLTPEVENQIKNKKRDRNYSLRKREKEKR